MPIRKSVTSSPIRLCTLCSGYDSQMMAMRRTCRKVDLVYWAEIDPTAIEAHNAVFPEYAERNIGDITSVNWESLQDFDVLTYSTPCTDISIAGKQQGFTKDSGTRSSIIWSVLDCIRVKKPKVLVMENVKGIVSKKFKNLFDEWCGALEDLGYTNNWQVMNCRDYGFPQNRERVIMISTLKTKPFEFPHKVDKYVVELKDLLTYHDSSLEILQDVISPFINREVTGVFEPNDTYAQVPIKELKGDLMVSCLSWSRDSKGVVTNRTPRQWCPCITSFSALRGLKFTTSVIVVVYEGSHSISTIGELAHTRYGIRLLSKEEAFLIMGVSEEDMRKILSVKVRQPFLLAGNSIVVDLLELIFNKLLKEYF